jgi:hypothetical protein
VDGENFSIGGGEFGQSQQSVEFTLRGAGREFPVFFRSSEAVLGANLEAFIACALLPAMKEGVGLDLAGPASERLVSALPKIVDIHTAWDARLSRVSLPDLVPAQKTGAPSGRAGAFFSGGVDSFYTFLKNRDHVTDIIFIHGFDIPLEREDLIRRAAEGVEGVAAEFGVGIVHVQTNIKSVLRSFVKWGTQGHGAALATIGHLLSPAFSRVYIASSCFYADLFPWGTHPLLDPLWSSESIEFIHDGCEARRVEKIEFIAGFDAALRHLRVCYQNLEGMHNCGHCEKCIRTMISLEAAGKLSQCATFERRLDARSVRRLRVIPETREFFVENRRALERRGLRPDLQKALTHALRWGWVHQARRRVKRLIRRLVRSGRGKWGSNFLAPR